MWRFCAFLSVDITVNLICLGEGHWSEKTRDLNASPEVEIFCPVPGGPLPCMFYMFPCSITPDSNTWVVIRLQQSLMTAWSFESCVMEQGIIWNMQEQDLENVKGLVSKKRCHLLDRWSCVAVSFAQLEDVFVTLIWCLDIYLLIIRSQPSSFSFSASMTGLKTSDHICSTASQAANQETARLTEEGDRQTGRPSYHTHTASPITPPSPPCLYPAAAQKERALVGLSLS